MNCSICGTANSDGADFCRHCGVSIMHAATAPPAARDGCCPRCGGDCALPARFCDRCGTRMAPQTGAAGREAATTPLREPLMREPPVRERFADAMLGTPAMAPIAASAVVAAAPEGVDDAAETEPAEDEMTENQAADDERRPGRGLSAPGARRRAALAVGAAAALAGVCVSAYWLADALLFGHSPWASPPALQMAAAQPAAQGEPAAAPPPPAAAPVAASPVAAPAAPPAQPSTPSSLPSEAALPLAGSADEKRAAPAATADPVPAKPAPVKPASAPRLAARKAPAAPVSSGDNAAADATAGAGSHETTVARREAADPGERVAPRAAPRVASVSWQTALRAQLAECGRDPNVFERIVCRERAKFRYCGPDHWGKAEECVQTRRRDPFAIDASG